MTDFEVTLSDGTIIECLPDPIGEGTEGIVYMTTDHKSAVKLYKNPNDMNDPERLLRIGLIVERYNPTLDHLTGKYWDNLFCWPDAVVVEPSLGFRMKLIPKNFKFTNKKEKKSSWFVLKIPRNILHRERPEELGVWLNYLQIAILIARGIRRLHSAGLAHSDISDNNILIDPSTGSAFFIDMDGLVVPGVHPPKVLGTPTFVAPEVITGKELPSIKTDLHSLAVLIYQLLLLRHPLKGPKVHTNTSAEAGDILEMGAKALFIEHPIDHSNRPREPFIGFNTLGPYISELIKRAFIDGLHDPNKRPTAMEWESALVNTTNILYPCEDKRCEFKWFVIHDMSRIQCPHCGWRQSSVCIPILNFYREEPPKIGVFNREKRLLIVWNNQSLYPWHIYDNVWPGENVDKTPQGYFAYDHGEWYLVNQALDSLFIIGSGTVSIGKKIKLNDGLQIRLSSKPHGRIALVQMLSV